MLVVASMLIWGTPVSGLQAFGYTIALGGMVYYKLGFDALKGYAGEAGRHWAEFGAARPAARKIVVIVAALLFVFILFGGLASPYTGDYNPSQYLAGAAEKFGVSS